VALAWETQMSVDSFRFLPRILAAFYQETDLQPVGPIPWTPLTRPLAHCRFGLVTSAGLYRPGIDPPFDLEREREEPTWGDPTYRVLPTEVGQGEVGASHLHIRTQDILADLNIVLPVHRFSELVAAGQIGGLAPEAYSFMGYQGFPPDTTAWETTYGPQVAGRLAAAGVHCALLTPA
jgi:D-proline reductase (dithiol) PrdB